jgi:hypothetical protein
VHGYNMHDAIDDQLCDPEQCDWEKRSQETANEPERHDCRARLPYDSENRRHISKGRKTLSPPAPEMFLLSHYGIL